MASLPLTVARLSTYGAPNQTNSTAYGATNTTQSGSPVSVLTATGVTSTEGTDMLTYSVPLNEGGPYLLCASFTVTTASNAATSHVATPVISFVTRDGATIGASGVAMDPALYNDADSGNVLANAINMKSPRADDLLFNNGYGHWSLVASVKGGTDIVMKVAHTIVGSTSAGKYAIDFVIIRL